MPCSTNAATGRALPLTVNSGSASTRRAVREPLARRRADHDAAGRRVALQPRAEVDRVAEDAVDPVAAVADDPRQHRPGVEPDAELRPVGVRRADRLRAPLQLERGARGVQRVVGLVAALVEDREDLIADEVLHLAAERAR